MILPCTRSPCRSSLDQRPLLGLDVGHGDERGTTNESTEVDSASGKSTSLSIGRGLGSRLGGGLSGVGRACADDDLGSRLSGSRGSLGAGGALGTRRSARGRLDRASAGDLRRGDGQSAGTDGRSGGASRGLGSGGDGREGGALSGHTRHFRSRIAGVARSGSLGDGGAGTVGGIILLGLLAGL